MKEEDGRRGKALWLGRPFVERDGKCGVGQRVEQGDDEGMSLGMGEKLLTRAPTRRARCQPHITDLILRVRAEKGG